MSNILRNVRGMRDLLNKDSKNKFDIENSAREVALKYGYEEINTPIVEHSEVFNKTLGETSDIVTKEMYNFKDEKNRNLTLRPEATAGIARAIVSNGLLGSGEYRIPLKFFLFGPMFRYERPQKGRYRQFYQINFESFSDSLPEYDVELISLAYNFLREINCPIHLSINTLGDKKSRSIYKKELLNYLNKYQKSLSDESRKRLHKNPLRILDSKNSQDIEIIFKAPKMINFLSQNSEEYYNEVKLLLKDLNIKFKEDKNLVRGLDYYKETVFEFKTDKLGQQQDTILGGGRYSGLVKMFGGSDIDGVGWAAGLDRLIDISTKNRLILKKVSIVFKNKYKNEAYRLSHELRSLSKLKIYVEIFYNISQDKQIKKSNKNISEYMIFIEDKNKIKILENETKKKHLVFVNDIKKIKEILDVT